MTWTARVGDSVRLKPELARKAGWARGEIVSVEGDQAVVDWRSSRYSAVLSLKELEQVKELSR